MDGIELLRINNASKPAPLTYDLEITQMTIDNTTAFIANEQIRIGLFHGYLQVIHPLTELSIAHELFIDSNAHCRTWCTSAVRCRLAII